jgi:signal peptidase I
MPPPSEGAEPSPGTYHRVRKRGRAAGAGLVVGLGVAYSFLRWRPFRVEISGPSMAPTLLAGDWALAVNPGRLQRGVVVVIEHPLRPGFEMVKRITGVPDELTPDGRILGEEEWWVEGDNRAESTDSRHFGPVSTGGVKARIRLIYWPPSRRRLIRGLSPRS